jgi:beta-phosphoglucomutase-like phosphatase (HAD superfamily)
MIKHIIFDFSGVILKHKATLIQDIINRMFIDSSNEVLKSWSINRNELLTGKMSSEQFLSSVKKHSKSGLTLEELIRQWKEYYAEYWLIEF